MTKIRGLQTVIILLAAAAILFAAYQWWPRTDDTDGTDSLFLHGNIDIREVSLAFSVRERIASVHAEEGARVGPGDLLAELEQEQFLYAAKQAHASAEAQRQVVRQLEKGTRPEELRRIRAEVEAARFEAQSARKTARRLRDLVPKQLASQEEADEASARADASEARLEAARARLALAEAGPRQEEIAAARARLDGLAAQAELADQNLAKTRLHSPATGVIRARLLQPGDMGGPELPVFTLALTEPLWARTYIDETHLGRVAPGMRAQIHSDSYPDKIYRGWVGYISPTAEFTPKSVETEEVRTHLVYQVRIHVCDPDDELRLGMPVTATIRLDVPPEGPIECP